MSLGQTQLGVWEWPGSCLFITHTLGATAGCQTPPEAH